MPTPDLSEFEELTNQKRSRRPCTLAEPIKTLSDEDRAALDHALTQDTERITAGGIQRWFAKRGHEVTTPPIVAHRTRKCRCFDGQ